MSGKDRVRLQIPCSPEHRDMLQAYADATGATLPKVCAQILEETAPIMGELAVTLAEARKAPAKAMRSLTAQLDRKVEEIDQMKMDFEQRPKTKKK